MIRCARTSSGRRASQPRSEPPLPLATPPMVFAFAPMRLSGARGSLYRRTRHSTISSSTDVSVVTRPLRRFFRIASDRLLYAVRGSGRSLAILDSVDPAFVGLFGNKIQTEFLADYTGEKTAHGVLLPFGGRHDRSNRSTGWCPQHRKNASVLSVRSRRGLWR